MDRGTKTWVGTVRIIEKVGKNRSKPGPEMNCESGESEFFLDGWTTLMA